MPLRAIDNPLVLPLLGLLLERPRHQYALLAGLRERYRHLRVRTSSVYTLVGSLRSSGWIQPVAGNRKASEDTPVAYRLTLEGTEQFRRKIIAGLEDADPEGAATFLAALAYIGILDRSTAATVLGKRIDALRLRANALERAVRDADVAPVHMIEVSFYASQTRHDMNWLKRFVQQIADPDYRWPMDKG